ncbi:hypothetical protein, partial [Reyranella sp.]|uniref:hypothetical protein n=1 Tax=Reyranella sp. TaxID=1929291 RepID=UPI002F93B827
MLVRDLVPSKHTIATSGISTRPPALELIAADAAGHRRHAVDAGRGNDGCHCRVDIADLEFISAMRSHAALRPRLASIT